MGTLIEKLEKSIDHNSTQLYNANVLKCFELRLLIKSQFNEEAQKKYLDILGAIEIG